MQACLIFLTFNSSVPSYIYKLVDFKLKCIDTSYEIAETIVYIITSI